MNKNSVHYLQGINFSQSVLAKKIEIKELVPAMPVLVISQSSSSRIQNSLKKFNPAINAKHFCKLILKCEKCSESYKWHLCQEDSSLLFMN